MSKLRTIIRKVDSNHTEIIKRLRKHSGLSVLDTHNLGRGAPDCVVFKLYGNRSRGVCFELKSSWKELQTPAENKWELGHPNLEYHVVYDYEQICKIMGVEPRKE